MKKKKAKKKIAKLKKTIEYLLDSNDRLAALANANDRLEWRNCALDLVLAGCDSLNSEEWVAAVEATDALKEKEWINQYGKARQ